MANCTLDKLREKEIFNLCDGRRLGCAEDLEFDADTGKICALLVPKSHGFSLGGGERIAIPWARIERIGADSILVDLGPEEEKTCDGCEKPSKRWPFH